MHKHLRCIMRPKTHSTWNSFSWVVNLRLLQYQDSVAANRRMIEERIGKDSEEIHCELIEALSWSFSWRAEKSHKTPQSIIGGVPIEIWNFSPSEYKHGMFLLDQPAQIPTNLSLKVLFTHSLHIIYRICNKCIFSISNDSWMSYGQWRNSYTFLCSLRYHFNSCIGVLLRSVW
jgi:hypothetical protein